MYCTVVIVQYVLYSMYCTVVIIQYVLYSMYCTVRIVQYVLYSTYCTVVIVQYVLYSSYCTVCIVQYVLYSMYYHNDVNSHVLNYLSPWWGCSGMDHLDGFIQNGCNSNKWYRSRENTSYRQGDQWRSGSICTDHTDRGTSEGLDQSVPIIQTGGPVKVWINLYRLLYWKFCRLVITKKPEFTNIQFECNCHWFKTWIY